MRHMDDYVVVGPHTKVSELTEDMGHTMLLRDVQFLEPGTPPVESQGKALWADPKRTRPLCTQ